MDPLSLLAGAIGGGGLVFALALLLRGRPAGRRRETPGERGDPTSRLLAEVVAARVELADLRLSLAAGADRVAQGIDGVRREVAAFRADRHPDAGDTHEAAGTRRPAPAAAAAQVPAEPGSPRTSGGASAVVERRGPGRTERGEIQGAAAPSPRRSTPEDAVAVWQRMLSQHGTMSARTAKESVAALGLDLQVHAAADVGWPADAPVLLLADRANNVWVLPDFSHTYASVETWFDVPQEAARTDNIGSLLAPARYIIDGNRFERGRVA